jgi:hypothetical protein
MLKEEIRVYNERFGELNFDTSLRDVDALQLMD